MSESFKSARPFAEIVAMSPVFPESPSAREIYAKIATMVVRSDDPLYGVYMALGTIATMTPDMPDKVRNLLCVCANEVLATIKRQRAN